MTPKQNGFAIHQLTSVRQDTILFKQLSAEIHAGDLLVIEGPNGSGKSTLLRMLAGLSTPYDGTVYWDGESIYQNPHAFFAATHYVGHLNGIKLGLTVSENLQLIQQLSGSCEIKTDVLKLLGLTQHQHALARTLSAGQKRRLALAKLFCVTKKLWLLDEPLTALDVTTQQLFILHLQKHLQCGGMAVISTHQPIDVPGHKSLRLPL